MSLSPHLSVSLQSVAAARAEAGRRRQEPLLGLSCAESEPVGRQAAGASGGADRLQPDLGLHSQLSNGRG